MRGAASLSLAQSVKKQFCPFQGTWTWGRIAPSLEPKKPGNEESGKGQRTIADEKTADPIVAFSRPPPLPPVLAPLVALSLFDSWMRRDSNDA